MYSSVINLCDYRNGEIYFFKPKRFHIQSCKCERKGCRQGLFHNKNYGYYYHEVQKKITIGQQNINYRISTFLGTFVHVMLQQMEPQLPFSDHSFCSSKSDIRYEPYLSSSDF